jgi:hypothetical protein
VAIVSVGAVVVGVALLFGALFVFQDRLVYFPDASGVGRAGDAVPGARDVSFETEDGLRLGAWFVPAAPGSDLRMAVLVAHGNGGNRADRAPLAAALARAGLSVLLFDYRGYGGTRARRARRGWLGTRARPRRRWPPSPGCGPTASSTSARAWVRRS